MLHFVKFAALLKTSRVIGQSGIIPDLSGCQGLVRADPEHAAHIAGFQTGSKGQARKTQADI